MKTVFIVILYFINLDATCQDTVIVYNILRQTDSEFVLKKEYASEIDTHNNFFEKLTYVNNKLRLLQLYDRNGDLYDYTYEYAIREFEYEGNLIKSIKLFDKNYIKVEDAFYGFWSVEFFYDSNQRIVKKIYRDVSGQLVDSYEITGIAPIIIYEYSPGGQLIKKAYSKNNELLSIDKDYGPNFSYKYLLN